MSRDNRVKASNHRQAWPEREFLIAKYMPWFLSTNPSKLAARGRNNSVECWITNKTVTFPGAIQIYHEIKRRKEEEKQVANEENA